jgi:hypothetical protein
MPVCGVCGCRSGCLGADASKVGGPGGVPETDGVGGEVDLVGKVVPDVGCPVHVPFRLAADKPAEVVVGSGGRVAVDPAVFELGEVGLAREVVSAVFSLCFLGFPAEGNLQEVDLVLVTRVGWVCASLLD